MKEFVKGYVMAILLWTCMYEVWRVVAYCFNGGAQ